MVEYTDDQLKEIISNDYGFNKDKITNPELCGLWHIRFIVNGIKYYGNTSFSGALPQLSIEGYTAKHYNQSNTPITEEYYNNFIKDRKIELRRYINDGDCEKVDIHLFDTQEEIKNYISTLDNPEKYFYEFI